MFVYMLCITRECSWALLFPPDWLASSYVRLSRAMKDKDKRLMMTGKERNVSGSVADSENIMKTQLEKSHTKQRARAIHKIEMIMTVVVRLKETSDGCSFSLSQFFANGQIRIDSLHTLHSLGSLAALLFVNLHLFCTRLWQAWIISFLCFIIREILGTLCWGARDRMDDLTSQATKLA